MRERDRTKTNRIRDILEDPEGLRDRLVTKLQGLWRAEDDFYHMIKDIGVCGGDRLHPILKTAEVFAVTSTATYIEATITM